jgi:hypothetical protein
VAKWYGLHGRRQAIQAAADSREIHMNGEGTLLQSDNLLDRLSTVCSFLSKFTEHGAYLQLLWEASDIPPAEFLGRLAGLQPPEFGTARKELRTLVTQQAAEYLDADEPRRQVIRDVCAPSAAIRGEFLRFIDENVWLIQTSADVDLLRYSILCISMIDRGHGYSRGYAFKLDDLGHRASVSGIDFIPLLKEAAAVSSATKRYDDDDCVSTRDFFVDYVQYC